MISKKYLLKQSLLFVFLFFHITSQELFCKPVKDISVVRKETRNVGAKVRPTIILDPGHGGKDKGTMSVKDRYQEKEIALSTALLVKSVLVNMGYKVIMTRQNDIYVPLIKRAMIANDAIATIFVSIHYNYAHGSLANGTEIYYCKDQRNINRTHESKKLGDMVLRRMVARTGIHSRGVKVANFLVIRETKMPAILVEVGFLSNPEERRRINDPKYRYKLAKGIAEGIEGYLGRK